MQKGLDIAVIGGGVVGLACARALQRDGHRVVVHDPAPASDTAAAWGSAGVFAVDSVSPFATPETIRALPAMLLQRDSGLSLRWGHVPRLLPWLARFLWNARPAAAEHGAAVLAALCAEGLPAWGALLGERAAARLVRPGGWVTAFETGAGLRAARADVERRQRHGVPAQLLDGPALRQRVPQLGGHVAGGVYYERSRFCPDPAALLSTLVADLEAAGGRLRRARVAALAPAAATLDVIADGQRHCFDRVVVAAGAHSRPLARSVGDDFPLDTERGYHVMLPGRSGPELPVMAGEHHFVTSPMTDGVRLAGTSELGGLHRAPDPRHYAALRRHAARLFPGLDTEGGSEWMGFRPTLPDSLPVIGPSPREPRAWYALGHQHLGLTLAGVTGRLVADGIAGRPPAVDLRPLRPDRF